MASKLLLYKKEQTILNESLYIKNPNFESDINSWDYYDGVWSWDSVNSAATYSNSDPNQISYLYNWFVDIPKPLVYYDVSFEINSTGTTEVYIGNDLILSGVNLNSVYTVTYQTPNYTNVTQAPQFFMLFTAGGPWTGYFTRLRIIRNSTLNPIFGDDIWMENGYLDLYDDITIALNFEKDSLSKFSAKSSTSSKQFKVPGTDNNNTLLGHLYENGAQILDDAFDPKNKTKAKLLSDEGVVIYQGWFIVQSIDKLRDSIEYDCQLFDDSFGIFDNLKINKLRDLNLSQFNHFLTYEDVSATWNTGTTWTDGYFYPIWYADSSDYIRSIGRDFYPVIFDRQIFDSIHRANNIQYELSPNFEEWLTPMVTTPQGQRPNVNEGTIDLSRVVVSGATAPVITRPEFADTQYILDAQGVYVDFNDVEQNGFGQYVSPNFTPQSTGNYIISASSVNISVPMSSLFPNGTVFNAGQAFDVRFAIYNITDDVEVSTSILLDTRTQVDTGWVITSDFSTTCDLEYGKTYGIRVGYLNSGWISLGLGIIRVGYTATVNSMTLDIALSLNNPISEGSYINIVDYLPEVTQMDFINDKVKQFNLLVIPLTNTSYLYTTEDEYYVNTKPILNWSGVNKKIDIDSSVNIQYLSTITSSGINFKYQTADDYHNEQYIKITKGIEYGENQYQFDTDFYSNVEEYELKLYEPTPLVSNSAGDVFSAIYVDEQPNKSRNLLISTDELAFIDPIKVNYENTSVIVNERRTVLHIDSTIISTKDLNFATPSYLFTTTNYDITPNNLFNSFYQKKLNIYEKGRLYTCFAKLNNNDIREIFTDFGRRVYVEEFNKYFIIQSIKDYDVIAGDKETTQIELLEYLAVDTSIKYIKPRYFGTVVNPYAKSLIAGYSPLNNGSGINNLYGGTFNTVNGYENNVYGTNNVIFGNNNNINDSVSNYFSFGVNNQSGGTSNTANFFNTFFVDQNGPSATTITIGDFIVDQPFLESLTGYSAFDVYVTGGTYSSGTATFTNTTGGTFSITGFSLPFTGGTVAGPTIFTGGLSADTISATTYLNLPLQNLQSVLNVGNTADISILEMEDSHIILATTGSSIDITSTQAIITGGLNNNILSGSKRSGLFAGNINTISLSTDSAIIAGDDNTITGGTTSQINGGSTNEIISGTRSTIANGIFNSLSATTNSGIFGGTINTINNTSDAGIFVGNTNTIDEAYKGPQLFTSEQSGIIGGATNNVLGSESSVIAGGTINTIFRTEKSFIGGGTNNNILDVDRAYILSTNSSIYSNDDSAILAGNSHTITGTTGSLNSILAGSSHVINNSSRSVILGGQFSSINGTSSNSGMLGGAINIFSGSSAVGTIGTNGGLILSGSESTLVSTNNSQLISTSNSTIINLKSFTGTTSNTLYTSRQQYSSATPTYIAPIGWSGSANGTDNGGTFTLIPNTNSTTTVPIFFINYSAPFDNYAPIVIYPANLNASGIVTYAVSAASGATIYSTTSLLASSAYTFNYAINPL